MADDNRDVYRDLEVPTAINAAGTKTRLGGTRIRPEAADAMRAATDSFARISDLQARASETVRDATGAEAGYVTTGAAAGLTLAAAACITGDDLSLMSRLPDTSGVPSEILIPKSHRNSYDHALRASGATLVDVGNNDRTLGPVATDLEPWELEAAVSDETVAVAYVARNSLPLELIVDVAHEHDLPVIVDAAGRLPPKENLTRFVDAGADLVVYSGGKGIRGPQSTGIVAGRTELISAIALQHLDMDAVIETWDPPGSLIDADSLSGVPRHGIGRGFKVGKEELVGVIRAVELYLEEDESSQFEAWDERAHRIGDALESHSVLDIGFVNADTPTAITQVAVSVDGGRSDTTAIDIVRSLKQETPRVFVGDRKAADGVFTINPMNLTAETADTLIERVIEVTPEEA